MSYHAMTNSTFPPADGIYEAEDETTSQISLLLCHGWSPDTISSWLEDEMESDPAPLIEKVSAEYARLVPEASEDAKRIEALHEALAKRNISFSFDEGYDKGEAVEDGGERAEKAGHRGYTYCTQQDVDRVIHTGDLLFGFGDYENPSLETDAEVAALVVEELKEVGFSPAWDGNANRRIACSDVVFEVPLAD